MHPARRSWTARLAQCHPLATLLLVAACVLLIADGLQTKHGHFSAENTFGFFPLCGALAPILGVLLARALRPLLQRKEDYYDG